MSTRTELFNFMRGKFSASMAYYPKDKWLYLKWGWLSPGTKDRLFLDVGKLRLRLEYF